MTHDQILKSLQQIGRRASETVQRLNGATQAELGEEKLRAVVRSLRQEIAEEYHRLATGKAQRTLTLLELSVYVPVIEGIWDQTDIKGLNIDGAITSQWKTALSAIVSRLSNYL